MILMVQNKLLKALMISEMVSMILPNVSFASMMVNSKEIWTRAKNNGSLKNADIIPDSLKMINIWMDLKIRLFKK